MENHVEREPNSPKGQHAKSQGLPRTETTEARSIPAVTNEAEGVNFYLRLGAIGQYSSIMIIITEPSHHGHYTHFYSDVGFGTGSMVHDGFRIAQVFETSMGISEECRQPLFILVACVHMLFVFFQTYFAFKSHRVSTMKISYLYDRGDSYVLLVMISHCSTRLLSICTSPLFGFVSCTW